VSVHQRRIAVPGEAGQLARLTQGLRQFWSEAGLPDAEAHRFELALEEIFMNVVMHGAQGGSVRQVELSLLLADGALTMTLEDDGPEFDPLSLPPADTGAGLAERTIGGLGVHLVRQIMDVVSYRRAGLGNRLSVRKRIETR
jgi:anti-sigma regulatory factor (Ser/Thr protein kinase)